MFKNKKQNKTKKKQKQIRYPIRVTFFLFNSFKIKNKFVGDWQIQIVNYLLYGQWMNMSVFVHKGGDAYE